MYDLAVKNNIMNWREQNIEKYNEYMNMKNKEYYKLNPDKFRKKRMDIYYRNRYYDFSLEWKRLLKINIS
jgi:hypothetical protein